MLGEECTRGRDIPWHCGREETTERNTRPHNFHLISTVLSGTCLLNSPLKALKTNILMTQGLWVLTSISSHYCHGDRLSVRGPGAPAGVGVRTRVSLRVIPGGRRAFHLKLKEAHALAGAKTCPGPPANCKMQMRPDPHLSLASTLLVGLL